MARVLVPGVLLAATVALKGEIGTAFGVRRARVADRGSERGAATFSRDIAPILFKRCADCHRPGGAGPFTLLSYQDAKRRAKEIADVTRSRSMPPWLPEPGYAEFEGERRLEEEEIDLIEQWVESGAQEGDLADLPPTPRWSAGWLLGKPDLVVTMPKPYTLAADGPDVFRKFAIPIPVPHVRYVRAVEFQPENARIVHHAVMRIDRTRSIRHFDEQDPEPGYGGMIFSEGESPEGHFLGWSPGKVPLTAQEGIAWPLEKGTDLILQLHLMPTGKPETIRSSIAFFFTNRPPSRRPFGIQLGSYTIDISPGEKNYVIEDSYELPVDVEVLGVYPHAHYLGKDMKGFAVLPDGTKKWLIWIKGWDFNWQDEYRYTRPISLPKGATLAMRYTYDNSTDNPQNPNRPPRRVLYGGSSSDEMGNLWIQVAPRASSDLAILKRDYELKATKRYIAGYEKMLRENPGHPAIHRALGNSYLRVGRLRDAALHLEASLRLEPDDPFTHYNLGNALAGEHRYEEAADHFRQALRIQPHYAEAHNNLGVMLQALGDLPGAAEQYREAVRLKPDYAEAHNNVGVMLQAQGRLEEAIRHFRRAVELNPQYALARDNLEAALREQRKR